ncbi:uncharacterized protein LOC141587816 [Silene latifolia]|uniref:uncharacterized protein LOC141587816 n=1 Tax=Silene latifolia TaxID=37657 RepID=UPI003D77B454
MASSSSPAVVGSTSVVTSSASKEKVTSPPSVVIPAKSTPVVTAPTQVTQPPKKPYVQALKLTGKGMSLSFVKGSDREVVIDEGDIEEEVEYWSSTLVGTVMGKQTSLVEYYARDSLFFSWMAYTWNVNGYPLVFKPWTSTVAEELSEITTVLIWVLFPNLDPCFWSQAALSKVASFVGRPICADEPTTSKSKITFAKILVEVDLFKDLPKGMTLQTPYRGTVLQKIDYEWVPHYCRSCKRIGHTQDWCSRNKPKQVYKPKKSAPQPDPVAKPVQDTKGFTVTPPKKTPKKTTVAAIVIPSTTLDNQFSTLATEPVVVNIGDEQEQVSGSIDRGLLWRLSQEGNLPLYHPNDHFLLESKAIYKSVFGNFLLETNYAEHAGGRLWVLWNPTTVDVQVLDRGVQFIHYSLLHHATQRRILVTFVYALNRAIERLSLWNSLNNISTGQLPWICLGDFNVSLEADEKIGCQVHDKEMQEFRDCLAACHLSDHPYTGAAQWSPAVYSSKTFALFSKLRRLRDSLKKLHHSDFTGITKRVTEAKARKPKSSTCSSVIPTHGTSMLVFLQDKEEILLGPLQILQGDFPKAMNSHLDNQVTISEIKAALHSIYRNKSPGMDGYTSGSFVDTWETTGQDFCDVVLEFFATSKMPRAANSTLVALIPKNQSPHSVTEFRPISCCTVYYKTVSKILANIMRGVLGGIIGLEQAAFIEGRELFDNSMLAHELAFKYHRSYITPRCILKVDIQKAFDSVNWSFIANCMVHFGFPAKFTQWILVCVTSSHFSISFNGSTEGFFPGKRGLRQGDPLSPYLFTMCMEVLSRLLRQLPSHSGFSYHPKCVKIKLTHLMFADDLLVFTRGDLPSIQAVDHCLNKVAALSGLRVNPMKSNLYFGGVSLQLKQHILATT